MAKILKDAGYHKILYITHESLKLIELAGRTAYQSQDKITDDSAEKFVKMIINRGHESVLEHATMTVQFSDISRGFTHELVRHRIASFTQESTRYVDESTFSVVIPPDWDADIVRVRLKLPSGAGGWVSFRQWMNLCEQMYRGLRSDGWPCQDARQVLPIGIKSQITMTANFREWRHVFKLRTASSAHWEIRRVMINLLKEVKELVPVVFEDISSAMRDK